MANPPLRLIPAGQLSELPSTENLGDTRFVSSGLNVIFGASGAYKSFYALDAALRLAQTHPVVYIAAEGRSGLGARVGAWCSYHKLNPGQLQFLCEEVNLRDSAIIANLTRTFSPVKPKLIVVDTLARCMLGGDENSAKDVGLAIHGCSQLQRAFAAAVCLIHHTNRADRGERGSGALRGAADLMMEVVSMGDGVIRVSCSKSKDREPWESEDLIFRQVNGSGLLTPMSEKDTFSIKLTMSEKAILQFLAMSVFESVGAQIQNIVNGLNISERHVYRLISGLKNKGLVRHVSKTLPMVLTDVGREMLLTFADKTTPITQALGKIEVG